MSDAGFQDGREAPLHIGAIEPEDVNVISALAQDAVFPASEMRWQSGARRFAILLNRFRWEDTGRDRHGPERVQSLLVIENVLAVSSQGIDRKDPDMILSLLSIGFGPTGGQGAAEGAEAGDDTGTDGDPGGEVLLTLAGDGAIRLRVEAVDMLLRDVTRPYRAPSGKAPHHD